MQKDLFNDEDLEPKWKVLKVKKIMEGDTEIVTYVLTEPLNWNELKKKKKFDQQAKGSEDNA